MKLFRSTSWVATFAVAMAAGTGAAQAQDPNAPTTPAPVVADPVPSTPTPTSEPAPVETQLMATTAAPVEETAPVEEAPAEEEAAWSDALSLSMFADAYYNMDWNMPEKGLLNYNGTRTHSAYVNDQGFGLAFLGLDASYSGESVGATASLRFGTGANRLIGQYGNGLTLENIWQAYATWMPTDGLTLDVGQFATVYGAEVGESWLNLNYTRGALYYYMQPFWHTGLRLTYQATDELAVKFLLTNGVNTGLASTPYGGPVTGAPDLGLQLAYAGGDLSAYLGYYGNLIDPDGKNWSHFVDLVLVGALDKVTVIFNGDLGVANFGEDADSQVYFGLSLAGAYAVSDEFSIALRGEFLSAPEDYGAEFGKSLITGTLTFDYKPADNIVIRLDNRLEAADADMFANGDSTAVFDPTSGDFVGLDNATGTYISSTLGVVVHTN